MSALFLVILVIVGLIIYFAWNAIALVLACVAATTLTFFGAVLGQLLCEIVILRKRQTGTRKWPAYLIGLVLFLTILIAIICWAPWAGTIGVLIGALAVAIVATIFPDEPNARPRAPGHETTE